MNALPSPNLPEHSPEPNKAPRRRSRANVVRANSYRRQRAEALTKLATYSALSVFGLVTLANLVAYNLSQQAKFQSLENELKDAKARSEQASHDFDRAQDPYSQQNVSQENSFKIAKDQLQVVVVNPAKPTAANNVVNPAKPTAANNRPQ
jgi:hypothetical protein